MLNQAAFRNSKFEYHLFPSVPPKNFPLQHLHDQTFEYWKNFWAPLLEKLDGTELCTSDFFRQTWIGVLFETFSTANRPKEYRVVGLHTSTYFNLDSLACLDHPYFKRSYEPEFVVFLKERGARSFMSIEYLTIDDAYRRRQINAEGEGLSFTHVMFGLAMNLGRRQGVDVVGGVARADLKVSDRARDFGMTARQARTFHNVPVTSEYVFRHDIKTCPLPRERHLINELCNETQLNPSLSGNQEAA